MLLVAVLLGAAAILAGPSLPGTGLVRAVAGGLLCSLGSQAACGGEEPAAAPSPLEAAYGPGLAALVERNAPDLFFEGDDFASLPVDFRECRSRSCADTIRRGAVHATQTGLPPTAFVHVVDCRERTESLAASRRQPAVSTAAAPGPATSTSSTGSTTPTASPTASAGSAATTSTTGSPSRPASTPAATVVSRASSHHGYNGRDGGIGSIGSDTGWAPRSAWEPGTRALHVAAGSHAGTTQPALGDDRAIHREDLVLVPAEPMAAIVARRLRDHARHGRRRSGGIRSRPEPDARADPRLPGRPDG